MSRLAGIVDYAAARRSWCPSTNSEGLLVKPDVASKQQEKEVPVVGTGGSGPTGPTPEPGKPGPTSPAILLKRFHGTVALDPTRVGRDAGSVADEIIAHLVGLVDSEVTVTLEIEAKFPSGAPDNVVRTVTENSRSLKFTTQGFEPD